MPPGLPYRGIRQAGFKINATDRWDYENSLNPSHDGPYGIAGLPRHQPGGRGGVPIDSETAFDRWSVTVWQEPGGGRLDVEIDGRIVERIETGAGSGARLLRRDTPPARSLRLIAADRKPVTVLDYGIENRSAGVIYDALGVVGDTVSILDRWDAGTVRQQIRSGAGAGGAGLRHQRGLWPTRSMRRPMPASSPPPFAPSKPPRPMPPSP